MRRHSVIVLVMVLIGGAGAWWWLASARPGVTHAFTGRALGSKYAITVVGVEAAVDGESLHAAARGEMERINRLLNTYQAESELSRFNASPSTDWVSVSADMVRAVELAKDVGQRSGGMYDITVGPLVNLWGFGPATRPARPPDAEAIAAAKRRVGLGMLEVRRDPPAMRKAIADLSVDLCSVADGFAVDVVAEALERRGVNNYLVEVGGELRAAGVNAEGRAWQIGIESPVAQQRGVQRVVPLSGGSIATSGDYRNYVEVDGVRYSHIINPSTGAPIRHALASVSVFDPSCMRADAWATAILVAGPEDGYALAQREKIRALLIVRTPEGFVEKWAE